MSCPQGLLNPGGQQQDRSGKTVRLQSFKIANCSNTPAGKTIFGVKSLSVSPDPVVMPGKLNIHFDIDVKESLDELQVTFSFMDLYLKMMIVVLLVMQQ